MIAGAVSFVLLAILTARFVTGGRGLLIGRLAGILSIYILVWLFIAVSSPATAAEVARFFAGGGAEAATGLTHFLGHMFGSR
jgi:hypothetical protein